MDAFAACAKAWPEVREYFLQEWRLDLADPTRQVISGAVPIVGLYLAAANADALFLDVMLLGMHLEADDQEVLFGDTLIDGGSTLMAMMARNSPDSIAKLEQASLPQRELEPDINALTLDSLALLVAKGAYAREQLDDLIRRISERLEDERFLLERTERHQWVASVLVNCGPGDLIEIVRGWFAEESGSEDPFLRIVALEEIEDSASHPEMRAGYWYSLQLWDAIEADTDKSLRWMMEEPEDEFEDDFVDEPVFGADPAFRDDDGPTMPLVRIEPKVGRNDPCPCGSGKKYKKCCGAN